MKHNRGSFLIKTLILFTALILPVITWGQGLPEGEHRDKVIVVCSACHGIDNIFNASQKMSAEDWEFYVYEMVARGAPVGKDDMKDIIEYLAENFTTKK
jgi:mono/diheme cytochrome c family protein